jgi:hypothetical protein
MASWPPSLRGDPHGGPASPSGDEQWKRKSALVASVYSGLLWAQQRANTMGETRKMRDTAAEWCGRERREDGDAHAAVHGGGRKGREAKVKQTFPMALHLGEDAIEEEGRLTAIILEGLPGSFIFYIFALPIPNPHSENHGDMHASLGGPSNTPLQSPTSLETRDFDRFFPAPSSALPGKSIMRISSVVCLPACL